MTERAVGVDGHRTPAEDLQALFDGNAFGQLDGLAALLGVLRQEGDAGGVGVVALVVGRGQLEAGLGAQQRVGQLEQDACTVAGGGLGTRGAAVVEVGQRGQAVGDDAVGTAPADVGHHGHTAGVLLGLRVVQTLLAGHGGEDQRDLLRRLVVRGRATGRGSARDDDGPLR